MKSRYGICECGEDLEPVWFIEEERKLSSGIYYKTGHKRRACSHLTCPSCLKNYCVDDSFDSEWYK